MSAHTPGPWRLNQGALLTVEADGHLGPIADVRSRLDYAGMHPAVAETREANARLICAAPELYSAVLQLIKADDAIQEDNRLMARAMILDAIHVARAAMAKAKGGAA